MDLMVLRNGNVRKSVSEWAFIVMQIRQIGVLVFRLLK